MKLRLLNIRMKIVYWIAQIGDKIFHWGYRSYIKLSSEWEHEFKGGEND